MALNLKFNKLHCVVGTYYVQGMDFPGGLAVKTLLPMQGTHVWSLGREDPLEEKMATRSSILAWNMPWTEEPGGV